MAFLKGICHAAPAAPQAQECPLKIYGVFLSILAIFQRVLVLRLFVIYMIPQDKKLWSNFITIFDP